MNWSAVAAAAPPRAEHISAHNTSAPLSRYNVYSQKVIGTGFINVGILLSVVTAVSCAARSRLGRLSICYDVRRRLRSDGGDVNCLPPGDMDARDQLRVLFFPGRYRDGSGYKYGYGLELLRIAGLDGVVAVRFAMMCAHFSVACTPVALLLAAVYRYGPNGQGKQDLQTFHMSNQRGALIQFLAVAAAWWISCTLMYLVTLEYKHFSLMRLIYFTGEHLEDAAKRQRDYYQRTVFVQHLPRSIRTHDQLRRAFESLFGGEVENAVLCSDVSALRKAVRRCERLATEKEAYERSGGGARGLLSVMFKHGGSAGIWRLFGKGHAARLRSAEQGVCDAYRAHRELLDTEDDSQPVQVQRSRTERYMMRALHHHIQNHQNDPHLTRIAMPRRIEHAQERSLRYSVAYNDQEASWWRGGPMRWFVSCFDADYARLISAGSHPCEELRQDLLWILCTKHDQSAGFVTFKSRSSQAIAAQMTLHQSSKKTVTCRAPFPGDIIWENLCIPDGQVRVRTFFSLCVMLLALVLWSFVAALIEAIANLDLVHQWLRTNAPKLSDNLYLEKLFAWGQSQQWWPALNGFLPALALTMLLVALPPLIRGWHRLYEGKKTKSEIMLKSVRICFVFNLVTMYVTAFSGSFLHSGLLKSGNPVEMTLGVIQQTASKLDDVAGYLTCYIFTKLGVRMLVYLCRPYKVLPWLLYCLLGDVLTACGLVRWAPVEGGQTPLLSEGPEGAESPVKPLRSRGPDSVEEVAESFLREQPCFDWIITDLSIILALCTMYGIMAPMIMLAALPFFWVYAGMVRYNVLFVYTQTYDSGGELFFSLVDTTFCALLLSLLLLQAYLYSLTEKHDDMASTIGSAVWHSAIPALMIVVVLKRQFLHGRYEHVCRAPSLQLAKELDEDMGATDREMVAEGDVYQDPAVSQAKIVSGGP